MDDYIIKILVATNGSELLIKAVDSAIVIVKIET